jgi:hypothetical protein
MITYTKLKYEQYFIDTSSDINNTGRTSFNIEYKSIDYEYNGILTHANYCVRYDEKRDVIQVHFEGTKDIPDWFTNFIFLPKYYDSFVWENKKITLKVHKSWAAMYKVMKYFVRKEVMELKELHKDAHVEVIGWSLGSGQAMLCVQDLNYNFGIKSHLYTFGSVNLFKTNIFNRRKTKKYLRSCCNSYHIFCNKNDIVTYVVPRIFGFIKYDRLNVKKKFNPFSMFRVLKNHFIYDKEEIYSKIYKRENRC